MPILLAFLCFGFSFYGFWRWSRIRKTNKATLGDMIPVLVLFSSDPVEGVLVRIAAVVQFLMGLVFAIVALLVFLKAAQ